MHWVFERKRRRRWRACTEGACAAGAMSEPPWQEAALPPRARSQGGTPARRPPCGQQPDCCTTTARHGHLLTFVSSLISQCGLRHCPVPLQWKRMLCKSGGAERQLWSDTGSWLGKRDIPVCTGTVCLQTAAIQSGRHCIWFGPIPGCGQPFCSSNLDHKGWRCLHRCAWLIQGGQNICMEASMC